MSKGDRVVGVYAHAKGGFEIKYIKDGKRGSQYRVKEDKANLLASKLAAQLEGRARSVTSPSKRQDKANKLPAGYDGTKADHWLSMLWEAAQLVRVDPSDEDAQRALRALSAAASAAKTYVDTSDIARELAEMRAFFEEIQSARDDGLAGG